MDLMQLDKETQEYVINVLRRGTITWKGRTDCLNRNRRKRVIGKKKDGSPKTLWERACDACGEWHLLKHNDLEVDHIEEVGPFQGCFDKFVKRLYCGPENLQALCFTCHSRKTSKFNSTLRFTRKNRDAISEL